MPRAGTIREAVVFRRVLESGARSSGPGLTVCIRHTGGPTRVGFVSGRSFGGAVRRNRGRRIMRAAWQQLSQRVKDGFDVVVIARPPALKWGSREAAVQMEGALRSLGAMDS